MEVANQDKYKVVLESKESDHINTNKTQKLF